MSFYLKKETAESFDFDEEELAKRVVAGCLKQEGFPYEAEVSLTLTDNGVIREFNRKYRQIDRPTDVLSFPLLSYERPGDFSFLQEKTGENFNPDTGEVMLGDIIISAEKVKEQAKEYGHSCRREMAFLIAHSMLHLFGYDHMEKEEAAVMEARQRAILEALGIPRE